MSMESFIEKITKKPTPVYPKPDAIPGTNKVRTYVGNSTLYSRQTTLERIGSKSYHPSHEHKEKTK